MIAEAPAQVRVLYKSVRIRVCGNNPCLDILKFQINFTVFLNMLADKLHGTDPEDVILNAFKLLDPDGTGLIPKVN